VTGRHPEELADELLELALKVGDRAADLLSEAAGTARTDVASKSSATDMVTEVDRASEDLIVRELLAARPDDGILAEEGSGRAGTSGVRWVVDPLDGTTNYLYGYGSWAVSIAAEIGAEGDSQVVAGVVIDAARGETFSAARGQGAQLDGEPIACSSETELSQALVATGFAYSAALRRQQADALVDIIANVRDIRRGGAAAVDLCSVACGRVDAYFERNLAWWDHAAGSLIAQEAGAVVEPFPSRPAEAGAVSAVAPALAGPMRDLLLVAGA
jgi:myo-inositol-1(or 4)-monophosphatase